MTMTGDEAYNWLICAGGASDCDPFDIHVAASVLALALSEAPSTGASSNNPVGEGTGLSEAEYSMLADRMFPAIAAGLRGMYKGGEPQIDDEEQSVRDILMMYASGVAGLEKIFTAMIARRCKQPHHLWQDLGLRERGELSRLMERHFTRLSARNHEDMKWKKFLYRMVCGSEGFTLCTTPVCSDCNDFEVCFGDESGPSRLARIGNPEENGLPA